MLTSESCYSSAQETKPASNGYAKTRPGNALSIFAARSSVLKIGLDVMPLGAGGVKFC